MKNSIFHDFAPDWLEKLFLIILLVSQIMVSAIPANAITIITSFLGDEKDDIQFIYYGGAVASAAIYPLISRFTRFFKRRHLLLYCLLLELILLIFTVISNDYFQLFICNFLLSSVRMIGLIICIGMFLKKFNPSNSRGLFYGIYYAISYSLSQIYSYLVALILQSYLWKFSFLISLPGIIISLFIIVFAIHPHRSEKKYPLYQIDWIGYLLFIIAGLSLAFVCIYGERLYWLDSTLICNMLLLTFISSILWTVRMLSVRRPYVDIRVLKRHKHLRVGILLMIALYFVYNTFAISTEFMKVNLGYNDAYLAATNLYLIIPFAICIPLTGIWLHHVHRVRESLFLGFVLFAIFYLSSATLFYPEQNSNFFMIPMIIRGAAFGISITSLSYYASMNIPVAENNFRAFFSIMSRTVIAAPVSVAFWNNRFKYFKQSQINILNAQYNLDDQRVSTLLLRFEKEYVKQGHSIEMADQLAHKAVDQIIYKQSLLNGAQSLYYILALICVVLAVLAISLKILNIHYVKDKNKYAINYVDL